jgi:hypothetical protein
VLSTGFSESANSTHFYSPFPPEQEDYTDDYDYESDSDLDANSDVDVEEASPHARGVKESSGRSREGSKNEPALLYAPTSALASALMSRSSGSPSCIAVEEAISTPETSSIPKSSKDLTPSDNSLKKSKSDVGRAQEGDRTPNASIDLGCSCRQVIIRDTAFLTYVTDGLH